MDYTIITPIDKAVASAASQSSGSFPWGMLLIGALAIAVLIAIARHEYKEDQLEDANLLPQ
jgi:uncharacterized oligopeptide transporter (OPT) family protein